MPNCSAMALLVRSGWLKTNASIRFLPAERSSAEGQFSRMSLNKAFTLDPAAVFCSAAWRNDMISSSMTWRRAALICR